MVWPIAGKIVDLTSAAIAENMLGGVTERYTEYRRLPDPGYDDLSHVIREVNIVAPDTIEVKGQFLATPRGNEVRKMFERDNGLASSCRLCPNMYGLAAKKADGTDDIEKETVCSIDILLDKETDK